MILAVEFTQRLVGVDADGTVQLHGQPALVVGDPVTETPVPVHRGESEKEDQRV